MTTTRSIPLKTVSCIDYLTSRVRTRLTNDHPKTNPSTISGEKRSGWDRFNGKLSPSEKERLREMYKEFLNDKKDSDTSDEVVVSD